MTTLKEAIKGLIAHEADGDVAEFMIILRHADGDQWKVIESDPMSTYFWITKLEAIKFTWMLSFVGTPIILGTSESEEEEPAEAN